MEISRPKPFINGIHKNGREQQNKRSSNFQNWRNGVYPKTLKDMENSKPNQNVTLLLWSKPGKKKRKRKRVCVLKPTFSGIRKANDEERKWENNERCFQRVAKTERPNKASRGRSSLLRVCLQLQNINPLCSLQWRKELERTKINKRIFLKVDFLLFIYFNQIKENILLLFFYFS